LCDASTRHAAPADCAAAVASCLKAGVRSLPVKRFFATLAIIWRLALPYFRSEDRWPGRALLAAVIAMELGLVAINVLYNQWTNRFYNALQEYQWDTFVSELLWFCMLATAFIVLAVYQLYLNQWLQIRWRRWMTVKYLEGWLDAGNHYRMQLVGDAADNPDQRIAEDIQMFVERTLNLGIQFLSSIVTLASFVVILWQLSKQAPLQLFGTDLRITGYLVWAAIFYAALGTWLTHLVGRALIWLNFYQQRYEADFRFNLVRVRENAEQIALLGGEAEERNRLLERFAFVVSNWRAIMTRTKWLTGFTSGYSQFSNVFPFVVVSPAYFAKAIPFGALIQTASAFGSVQGALSVIVIQYRSIAEWRSVVERLAGFSASIEAGRKLATTAPAVDHQARPHTRRVEIDRLELRLPNGSPLIAADKLTFGPGERVLVTGPTGSGKSTLFRAIAGIWPFGSGSITVPSDARLMVLPQRPYLPVATLRAAATYPAAPDRFSTDTIRSALEAVGLRKLVDRLDETAHWNRMLSLGEQQRLAVARALLHAPDYLLLDEATASLDEPSEAALYTLIGERLPGTSIVSIGHRSTLNAFHRRTITVDDEGDRFRAREAALAVA
jgi:vitamin B12/bleomycin/antimicrobial peptide transport system ATP-binding/permease protein